MTIQTISRRDYLPNQNTRKATVLPCHKYRPDLEATNEPSATPQQAGASPGSGGSGASVHENRNRNLQYSRFR